MKNAKESKSTQTMKESVLVPHLSVRYIGLMAKSGNVCTLIMITIKQIYKTVLIKPERDKRSLNSLNKKVHF